MATAINAYATLQHFKDRIRSTGQDISVDVIDDDLITRLLEDASRYIDDSTNRTFYPRVETRYYDTPRGLELDLDDDLLEVISLTNGDDNTISSSYYRLLPANKPPYSQIKIKDVSVSAVQWEWGTSGDAEGVIEVAGVWGYHDRYAQRAWKTQTTLGAAMTTTTGLTFTVTSAAGFSAGQVIRIDNELCIVSSSGSTSVGVLARGDNGSTAATHSNAVAVKIWQPMGMARQSVLDKAVIDYHNKYGANAGGQVEVTAAGVVIMPNGVPRSMNDFIKANHKWL